MAKQSFVTGQVLTAQQVNDLQTNDFNQTVSAKTASYTLVAADKGTRITMSSTSATTITINTSLFSAGDTLFIQNLNTGVSTITAGTATVTTASSLALAQWEGGTLYFTSASAAIFFKSDGAAASAGGLTFQNVADTSERTTTSTSFVALGSSSAVTMTTGTKALVLWGGQIRYYTGAITFDVSGATSSTGDDSRAYFQTTSEIDQASRHFVITGLTAGSNTFTLKYR